MTRTRLRFLAVAAALAVVAAGAGVATWHEARDRLHAAGTRSAAPASSATTPLTLVAPRPLPDLNFSDAEGKSLTLADFRGRVVLLNLWATWCVPCRTEMPTLDRLEANVGGPNFEVVALSIDGKGLGAVNPFFQELELKALHVYLDPSGKAAFAIEAPGIPTTLLIDREGREIARKVGPEEWDRPGIVDPIRRLIASGHPAGPQASPERGHSRPSIPAVERNGND